MEFDLGLDLFPLLAATLSAVGCGILGNFLVLRRLSLMGDAMSHSVLPGLVIAFLVTSSRHPSAMFLGATIAGVLTVIFVEFIKRFGRVESGAAMGVVFSILFALGVLLIEKASARQVDLDADCVLHGQLETLVWYTAPSNFSDLFQFSMLQEVPRQIYTLAIMVVCVVAFTIVLFKELRISAFDPALAITQGINAAFMHYLLMILVAFATVASFEAVGSILVIAMLVGPASIARVLTDKLSTQVVLSVFVSIACGVGGYFAATWVPSLFNKDAVNAAGSISMLTGVLLTLAIIGAPKHGVISRTLTRRKIALQVAIEDVLADLYRLAEGDKQHDNTIDSSQLRQSSKLEKAIRMAQRQGYIIPDAASLELTPEGFEQAKALVRKHRLWETYLVEEAGFLSDHVHQRAEQLEHIHPAPSIEVNQDPHGKSIP